MLAHWEWFEETISNINAYEYEYGWRCSCCKSEPPGDFEYPDTAPEFPYCPYCGAKMDLKISEQIAEGYIEKMKWQSQEQSPEQAIISITLEDDTFLGS